MLRIRTFGIRIICAAVLAAVWFPTRAQIAPFADETAALDGQGEVAAPADHLMASACLAEMRALHPPAGYTFSQPVFTRSQVLGQVVRFDHHESRKQDVTDQGPVASHRLVCFQRQPDAKLEMYVFTGMALGPEGEISGFLMLSPPFRN